MSVSWKKWLKMRYYFDNSDFDNSDCDNSNCDYSFTVIEWVESLVYEGIMPHFEKVGYLIAGTKTELVETILNYIYRLEYNYFTKGEHMCFYKNKHGYTMTYTMDDLEFYHTVKCSETFWNRMRKEFRAPQYADDSEFANVLWDDIPYMLFFTINIDKSNATYELQDKLTCDDDDDNLLEESDTRKKDIDPYLLNYGGAKYKKYD